MSNVQVLIQRAAQALYIDGVSHIREAPPFARLHPAMRQPWEHRARVALVAAFPPLGLPPRTGVPR